MNRTNIKGILLILVVLVFRLLQVTCLKSDIVSLIFWIVLGIISFILVGTINKRKRTKIDTIQIITISLILYLIINYFIGMVLGFTTNNKTLVDVLLSFTQIIMIELTRYAITTNISKKNYIVIVLIFTLVGYTNINTLLPLILTNILLTYMTYVVGPIPSIIYSLIINLYPYIIPVVPNIGVFTRILLDSILPIIILIVLYNLYKKDSQDKHFRKSNYMYLIPVVIILIPIICLTLGIGKYKTLGIVSNSMAKVFGRGTLVIYKKIDNNYYDSLNVDDILIYNKDNTYIVHRIIKKDNNLIITKGDSNEIADYDPVNPNQYIGVVKIYIPYIGYPAVWVQELLSK